MGTSFLTPAARRHVGLFLREIAGEATRLQRRFRSALLGDGFDDAQCRALLAISPACAADLKGVGRFLDQVEDQGRRLAKLNVSLEQIAGVLRCFDTIAGELVGDRFQPAREQLQLATRQAAGVAFYQVREAEAQALFGVARAEAEAGDLQDLLRRLLGVLTRTFHAKEGKLLTPCDVSHRAPLYIRGGTARERLIADPSMRGRYASYWSYPMAEDGLLQLGFPTEHPWLPREMSLMAVVAARCREAIGRTRDRREIRRLEAEARAAEEAERRRIGRELHDEAGQSLMLLRLKLEMLEREAPPELRARLAEARSITEETAAEVRRIIAALSPAVLERLGLERAVQQLAARFRKNHGATLRVRIAGDWLGVPGHVQEVIYRVAQESLQNIAKHSGATHVNLLMQAADTVIRLRISDNGAGFSENVARRKPDSFGLAGMRERAMLLGGTLTIRSARAKGTTVTVELPNGKDSSIVD